MKLILYAAVTVALSEGMWMPNRQKRQDVDTTTTEDPSMSPSTVDEDTTTTPATSDDPTTTTSATSDEPTTTLPTTTPSSTTSFPSSANTTTTVSPPPSSSSEIPGPPTTTLPTTSSSTTSFPSSTNTPATVSPTSSSGTPGPTYLPPTQLPSNHSGYDYPPPLIPFTYPPYGKIQPQNYAGSNRNWPSANTQNTRRSWNQPTNHKWHAWINNRPHGNYLPPTQPPRNPSGYNYPPTLIPGPPYLPPTQPPSNHSGYDNSPPPIPFTYPPYGKIQPQNYRSNSNWPISNKQNTQRSWNQPTNKWNAWMNRPYGNSPNIWNQWKNSITRFWGTPKSNGGWKPTFGPYGNNTNYGQWQLKPQGNTRWANSYSPNINRQLGQWTNIRNHFRQTHNKGDLWSKWFNL